MLQLSSKTTATPNSRKGWQLEQCREGRDDSGAVKPLGLRPIERAAKTGARTKKPQDCAVLRLFGAAVEFTLPGVPPVFCRQWPRLDGRGVPGLLHTVLRFRKCRAAFKPNSPLARIQPAQAAINTVAVMPSPPQSPCVPHHGVAAGIAHPLHPAQTPSASGRLCSMCRVCGLLP